MKKKTVKQWSAIAMTAILGLTGCQAPKTAETPKAAETVKAAETAGTQTAAPSTEAAPKSSEPVTLSIAWWGNQVRNDLTAQVLNLYSQENSSVKFESEFTDFNGYWSKAATLAASNSLQDVIQMNFINLPDYAENGLILDLTPYVENGTLNLDNVAESTIQTGVVNDKIYAICLGINAPALMYNKEITDQAGVTISDSMTVDEFIDICRTVYEKTGVQTNLNGCLEHFVEYWCRDNGYVLFDGDHLGVPDAAVLTEFFKLYEMGIKEGWHMPGSHYVELASAVETDPVVTGKSWFVINFSNLLRAYENAANTTLGITTWPANNLDQANYIKPALYFSVAANSPHPEEAVKVLDYFTNSIPANEILLGERGVPISSVIKEDISPLIDESTQREVAYLETVELHSSPMHLTGRGNAAEVTTLINSLVEQLLYGKITAEEAGAQLFEQGNAIMAK